MYLNKFQQGGSAEQLQMDEQLNMLAGAMIQLQQLLEAAQGGDKQAVAVMQEIQKRAQVMMQQSGNTQMAKCGAKIKRKNDGGEMPKSKTKYLCGGKKLENGDKVKKAKAGCQCLLKKEGGRLIEVDSCTGKRIR